MKNSLMVIQWGAQDLLKVLPANLAALPHTLVLNMEECLARELDRVVRVVPTCRAQEDLEWVLQMFLFLQVICEVLK